MVLAFVAYAILEQSNAAASTPSMLISSSPISDSVTSIQSSPVPTAPPPTIVDNPAFTPAPTKRPVPTAPPPTRVPAPQGRYKNGNYTGSVNDAVYGSVQVQVAIRGGKIAAINFLQYPNDNYTSAGKSSMAVPILTSEAIQAQSANVQIVSSVTFTSQAFMQSLQTALNQAS